jgi:hypothetical protein
MVWNTQDAKEKQESEPAAMVPHKVGKYSLCYVLGYTLCAMALGPLLGFGFLLTIGPTVIADFLFFWKKRQFLRKHLVSTSVPIELHIVHRRQLNRTFFIRLGYQMDNNVSYIAKNEEAVTERIYELTKNKNTVNQNTSSQKIRIVLRAHTSLNWKNGILLGNVSSSYPASGPCYSKSFFGDDELCSMCYNCFWGLIFTAFTTFVGGVIAGARTILGFFATAGVLIFIGFLISAYLYFSWRNTTLYGYQVVDELPSAMIDDDDDDDDDDKNNDGLEMGMLAVQEDDDTETLAFTEEYISSDEEGEDEELKIV